MKYFLPLTLLFLSACTTYRSPDGVSRNRETAKDRYMESYYHNAKG